MPRRKPLDFVGYPDHITLALELGEGAFILRTTSAAVAEVCTLLCTILVN